MKYLEHELVAPKALTGHVRVAPAASEEQVHEIGGAHRIKTRLVSETPVHTVIIR